MSKSKKCSKDYPQFYCRMAEQDKVEIETLVNSATLLAVKKWQREGRTDSDLKPKRNEFVVQALKHGLNQIIKNLDK